MLHFIHCSLYRSLWSFSGKWCISNINKEYFKEMLSLKKYLPLMNTLETKLQSDYFWIFLFVVLWVTVWFFRALRFAIMRCLQQLLKTSISWGFFSSGFGGLKQNFFNAWLSDLLFTWEASKSPVFSLSCLISRLAYILLSIGNNSNWHSDLFFSNT